jgi:hypothetical protein
MTWPTAIYVFSVIIGGEFVRFFYHQREGHEFVRLATTNLPAAKYPLQWDTMQVVAGSGSIDADLPAASQGHQMTCHQ